MRFSERHGHKQTRVGLQIDEINDELRTALWNSFLHAYGEPSHSHWKDSSFDTRSKVAAPIWERALHRAGDELPEYHHEFIEEVKQWFSRLSWFEVYDFIEHLMSPSASGLPALDRFAKECNTALASHLSGYRIVNGTIVPVTSPVELASIERALAQTECEGLGPVHEHLQSSIDKLSNREKPDYRNCVKEAISAVESMCKLIARRNGATLPEALKVVEQRIPLHQALKQSWIKLYGWTSDAEGIRHALMDEPSLSQADARYMLVSCSAFIGMLIEKCSDAGVPLCE